MSRKYRYKKSYRTKKKISIFNILKIILKNKFFWLGLFFFIILSGFTYLFIFSPVFQIKNIQVSGTEKSPSQEIQNIISANVKNIFLTDLEKINKVLLKKYPQIAKVTFKIKLPNQVLAQIEERKPVLVFCQIGLGSFLKFFKPIVAKRCFFVDNQGILFEEIDKEAPGLLLIKTKAPVYSFILGQEIIKKEYLEKILKINSKLKNNIQVSEISLISENRLNIKTLEDWQIYFNPKEDLNWQIEELEIILKQKIPSEDRKNLKYIDLRFEKVYIKERRLAP